MACRHVNIQLVAAWACLLAGILIYLLFRSRLHLGFAVLDGVGLSSVVDAVRECVQDCSVPEFVRYCLPDGLWTSSYILFSDYYNRVAKPMRRLAMVCVIPLVGCVSELLQYAGVMPGVFDLMDLLCYALPFAIYLLRSQEVRENDWQNKCPDFLSS